jgi:predicted metal-binding protein
MTTTLLLCETCGQDAAAPSAARKGELFATEVEGLLQEQLAAGAPPLLIKRTRCLMACQRHCTALLQAHGKIAYVLGDFQPEREAAEALLDYSRKYQQSDTGQVPFRTWPAGIKGKFIARIPPLS